MIALKLIQEDIEPLEITNTLSEALKRMDVYKVSHFPVVEDKKLVGLISEKDILNQENLEDELITRKAFLLKISIYENQHVFDLLKITGSNRLSIISIVDEDNYYLGSVTNSDILFFLANSFSINAPGGVIILEIAINDYSLSEIANIVESNNAKILSSFILSEKTNTNIEVVLKITNIDVATVIQTFERYGYNVLTSFSEESDYEDLQDNYDSLINFLKI